MLAAGVMSQKETIDRVSRASRLLIHVVLTFFFKFELGALTQRRSILDPGKLQSLNKLHLQRKLSSSLSAEQDEILDKAREIFKTVYPNRSAGG